MPRRTKRRTKKTARRPSKKGIEALKFINKEAHRIRREKPNIKWKTAIKEASAIYRKNKK